jgi:hypothetical protein
MNLTTQQLAEILIGVARAQQAIIDAIDSSKAGFKGTYMAPALDSTARIRSTGRPLTLQDFPARVLLQCQGRAGPNVEQITRDLEALLAGLPRGRRCGARRSAPGRGCSETGDRGWRGRRFRHDQVNNQQRLNSCAGQTGGRAKRPRHRCV